MTTETNSSQADPRGSDRASGGGSPGTVRITPARQRREAARERARQLRLGGASYDEIAVALDVSRSTAYSWTRAVVDLPRTQRRTRREGQVAAARALRQQGLRYADIAERFRTSVATAYAWTSDVVVRADDERDAGGRTRAERRETSRRAWEPRLRDAEVRRQQTKLAAAHEMRPVLQRDLFVAGLVAYWAEGTKDKDYRRQERLVFTNSDPLMVRLFCDWLDLLQVEPERRRYRVSIHETADAAAAERHWAEVLHPAEPVFQSATIKRHDPATNRLRTGDDYHGCLVVGVTQSADLYRREEGWWYGLAGPGRHLPAPPATRIRAGSIAVQNHPGSSSGRTSDFGSDNRGSNPLPGAGAEHPGFESCGRRHATAARLPCPGPAPCPRSPAP